MGEQVTIKKVLAVAQDETKTFADSQVHFKGVIKCAGRLEFANCTLHYNEYRFSNGIVLTKTAEVSFKNCTILCEGADEQAFIRGDSCRKLYFADCTFTDCLKFLSICENQVTENFSLSHCQLVNCSDQFVEINLAPEATACLTDTKITEDKIADFNKEAGGFRTTACLFKLSSIGNELNVLVANTTVEETDSFKRAERRPMDEDNELSYFTLNNARVEHCTFRNVHNCLTVENTEIRQCEFIRCDNVVASENCSLEHHLLVDNCLFVGCTRIITSGLNSLITKCAFNDCYGKLLMPGTYDMGGTRISYCVFNGIKYLKGVKDERITSIMPESLASSDSKRFYKVDACLTFSYNQEDGKQNQLSHCRFTDIELGKDVFLIQSVGEVEYDGLLIKLRRHKPYGSVAYIKDCQFTNITTQRKTGKIIKEYVQYDTLFNKNQNFLANIILDCKGLEAVQVVKNKHQKAMSLLPATAKNPT